jgi:1-acyl-sn-glycerol-3-phosphate acyltransferase
MNHTSNQSGKFYSPTPLQRIRLSAFYWFTHVSQMLPMWPIMALLFLIKGYRFIDARKTRADYLRTWHKGGGPIIICANHLTWIDPFLLSWIIAPPWHCFFTPSLSPWGYVGTKYMKKLLFKPVFALTRAIPVAVGKEENLANWKFVSSAYHLTNGHTILLFPEGRRSKTGFVESDRLSTGVGYLLKAVPKSRVFCIYQRGLSIDGPVNFPASGERFIFAHEEVKFSQGDIASQSAREISQVVINRLVAMEKTQLAVAEEIKRADLMKSALKSSSIS